jgi:DNA-binding MarR family transcriptional regulator
VFERTAEQSVAQVTHLPAKPSFGHASTMTQTTDTTYLQSLIGYNARRVALVAIGKFLEKMSVFGLRPVDFSVLSLINHNPGITSRALCRALSLQPPNLVGQIAKFEQRGLISRQSHANDKRAIGLSLTEQGQGLMNSAEKVASEVEASVLGKLTPKERQTLMKLLQKVYL